MIGFWQLFCREKMTGDPRMLERDREISSPKSGKIEKWRHPGEEKEKEHEDFRCKQYHGAQGNRA